MQEFNSHNENRSYAHTETCVMLSICLCLPRCRSSACDSPAAALHMCHVKRLLALAALPLHEPIHAFSPRAIWALGRQGCCPSAQKFAHRPALMQGSEHLVSGTRSLGRASIGRHFVQNFGHQLDDLYLARLAATLSSAALWPRARSASSATDAKVARRRGQPGVE